MAQKLDRKELKKPDEFQVVAGKVMGWVAAHQKPVLAGLIVLAVAVLGGWAASAYSNSRDAKAGAELATALELSARPLASEAQAQTSFPQRNLAATLPVSEAQSRHQTQSRNRQERSSLVALRTLAC